MPVQNQVIALFMHNELTEQKQGTKRQNTLHTLNVTQSERTNKQASKRARAHTHTHTHTHTGPPAHSPLRAQPLVPRALLATQTRPPRMAGCLVGAHIATAHAAAAAAAAAGDAAWAFGRVSTRGGQPSAHFAAAAAAAAAAVSLPDTRAAVPAAAHSAGCGSYQP
eukprot:1160760-Pelagomonas_calceolata.AAC.7